MLSWPLILPHLLGGLVAASGGRADAHGHGRCDALRKAALLIERVRGEAPASHQIPLSLLTRRFHESKPAAPIVIACARHLIKAGKPEMLTHVLAVSGRSPDPTLIPVSRSSIGAAYGNGAFQKLVEQAHGESAFVSDVYLQSGADASDAHPGVASGGGGGGGSYSVDRWRAFFVAAGSADGLSFVVSTAPLPSGKIPTNVRKNAKQVVCRMD